MALPDNVSNTGFLAGVAEPEDRVACRGALARPGRVEEASLVPSVAWKRAMMALTSALLSWRGERSSRLEFTTPPRQMCSLSPDLSVPSEGEASTWFFTSSFQ